MKEKPKRRSFANNIFRFKTKIDPNLSPILRDAILECNGDIPKLAKLIFTKSREIKDDDEFITLIKSVPVEARLYKRDDDYETYSTYGRILIYRCRLTVAVYRALSEGMTQRQRCGVEDPSTPLSIAIEDASIEVIKEMLKDSPPNYRAMRDMDRQTPLHRAAYHSWNPELFKLLLEGMPKKYREMRDERGDTALHVAAEEENLVAIESLLEGMPLEYRHIPNCCQETCLMRALKYPEIAERLLKDSDPLLVKICDELGQSPLIRAIEGHCTELVKLLLKYCTKEDILSCVDIEGDSGLMVATCNNNIEIMIALLNWKTKEKEPIYVELLKQTDYQGDTAFSHVTSPEAAELLICFKSSIVTTIWESPNRSRRGQRALNNLFMSSVLRVHTIEAMLTFFSDDDTSYASTGFTRSEMLNRFFCSPSFGSWDELAVLKVLSLLLYRFNNKQWPIASFFSGEIFSEVQRVSAQLKSDLCLQQAVKTLAILDQNNPFMTEREAISTTLWMGPTIPKDFIPSDVNLPKKIYVKIFECVDDGGYALDEDLSLYEGEYILQKYNKYVKELKDENLSMIIRWNSGYWSVQEKFSQRKQRFRPVSSGVYVLPEEWKHTKCSTTLLKWSNVPFSSLK